MYGLLSQSKCTYLQSSVSEFSCKYGNSEEVGSSLTLANILLTKGKDLQHSFVISQIPCENSNALIQWSNT